MLARTRRPEIQEEMLEALDEHKEALGSETYRQLCLKLKKMDEVHVKLVQVCWANLDISSKDGNKIQHRRRTSICRLLPDNDAVSVAQAELASANLGTALRDVPGQWYKWLYHSLITPLMLTEIQRHPNMIIPNDNNSVMVVFSCSEYSVYGMPKKRAREEAGTA